MSSKWEEDYKKLLEFISENPDIKIGANSIAIPGNTREAFYHLFDTVRVSLALDKIPQAIEGNKELCRNYLDIAQRIKSELNLENIILPPGFETFTKNPEIGLVRDLFDPLFNLIRERITASQFEAVGIDTVKGVAAEMQQMSYDLWSLLSIVELCDVDKVYAAPVRQLGANQEIRSTTKVVEPLPEPLEANFLSFKNLSYPVLIVPQVLMHSRKIKRYFSARVGLEIPKRFCDEMRAGREVIPITTVKPWYSGAILFYLSQDTRDLSAVADAGHVCKPDMLVICRPNRDWEEPNGVDYINEQHKSLAPRLGTYVVTRESPSEQTLERLEGNIKTLTVDLASAGLEPIINTLTNA